MTDIKPIEAWCVVNIDGDLCIGGIGWREDVAKDSFLRGGHYNWSYYDDKGYRCIQVTITPRVK